MKKETHTGKKREEKKVLMVVVILCVLAVCVAAYGIRTFWREGSWQSGISSDAESRLPGEDSPAIRSIVIGDTEAQIEMITEGEKTFYVIRATLPAEFPFEKTTLNLELEEGATLTDESNCILTDLGGRFVVNLTVEDAKLVIKSEEETREYRFRIEVM